MGNRRSFLFQYQSAIGQILYNHGKKLLVDAVPDQQIAELSYRVSVRNLIAGFHAAKIRKGTAVNDFIPRAHIGQIIQILQQVDAEHQFKLVGLISVLPLVIVRPDQLLQLFSRHNPLDPFQQYSLVRADFFQFVVQKRHAHLLVHVFIIALFCPVFNVFVLRGDALSKKPVISRVSCIKNC